MNIYAASPIRSTPRRAVALAVGAALVATLAAGGANHARAQQVPGDAPREPVVTVAGRATASVANDRIRVNLRAEADNASAATAASDVNARIAKALAKIKGAPGVTAQTSGYSSYQVTERDRPARWRVSQSLTLEGTDFPAMTTLVSSLQGDGGLLLSGLQFLVSDELQRQTEDRLTQQALKAWQERAARAAQGLGFATWRPGRVNVETGGDGRPPYPMMRAAPQAAAAGAPVAFEAGSTEVSVTVSGEAVLERKPTASR
jgi:predicted secreted protein